MRSLVMTTGSSSSSSSSIVTQKHHHNHHLFSSKHHPFLSLHTLFSLSLPKPTSPHSSSSSSTPSLLISPHFYPSNNPNNNSNLRDYADIASKLVEDCRFEEFKMVVETVISSGVIGFGELLNPKLLVSGIVKGVQEGNVKGVVGLFGCFSQLGFDVLRVFDGSTMELLRKECCRMVNEGCLEDAVELMEALGGAQFSIKDLVKPGDMIRMLISRSSPCLAVRYTSLLPQAEVFYCTIIREFGKRSDLVSALRAFEASKKKLTGTNMYLYRTIIDVCGMCGNCFKSRLIYEDLMLQKITPNIFVFNSLMNVNAHDLAYTMEVYKQMKIFHVNADMTTYNILLKACCLSERVDLAQDIYREVQCLESSGALKMDVFTYSTIIKVFADAKLWQMAIKIKEDMLSAGVTPNTVTWSSLISACANAGLVDQASQLFEEMLAADCLPNSQCFNTLLHACVEACQYDRAFRLFNTWKSSGSSGYSTEDSKADLETTSRVQLKDKDPVTSTPQCATALRHLHFAKSIPFKPSTSTYNILLKACGTDFYRAKDLLDEMRTLGLFPNHISWSILIDICGAAGHVHGALKILKSMGESGIRPDVVAYTTAIKVCMESKNSKMAFMLFAEMKRLRIKPNLVTYNTLLRARRRYGSVQEIQQCLAVYQDMRKAGYKSNDYCLKLLIEEWCEGVIQSKNQEGEYNTRNRADIGGLRSLLLDRVATHLQKNLVESLAVDVQGLTKVEARLVVLAALRMMKEKYKSGHLIKDDLIVILGIAKVGAESPLQDGLTKLLRKELGLEVLSIEPSVTVVGKIIPKSADNAHSTSNGMLKSKELLTSLDSTTRRPAVLQRLLVTKESINHWLKRRLDSVSRYP